MEIDGVRIAGSKNSSPFLYFRGGRDSPDHYVPLYFGGGFSGVVMDINDGTQNDYSDFYLILTLTDRQALLDSKMWEKSLALLLYLTLTL